MWSICRVDKYNDRPARLFEVQAVYKKADLDIEKARKSGFVGPDDELVILSPSGRISEVGK